MTFACYRMKERKSVYKMPCFYFQAHAKNLLFPLNSNFQLNLLLHFSMIICDRTGSPAFKTVDVVWQQKKGRYK